MRKRFGIACLLVLAMVSARCGSSTSPSTLTGTWMGTAQYTVNGQIGTQNITVTLSQQGTTVTGTYVATSVGYFVATVQNISGTASGTFTGTFNFAPAAGLGCSGTFDVSGGSGGSAVTWNMTGVTSTCGSFTPSAIQLQLTR
jgi:hypothetical protein